MAAPRPNPIPNVFRVVRLSIVIVKANAIRGTFARPAREFVCFRVVGRALLCTS